MNKLSFVKQLTTVAATATLMTVGMSIARTQTASAASITNGGFETGDHTGWTVVKQENSGGDRFITEGATTQLTGSSIPNPTEGSFFSVTAQGGPGSYVLFQDIVLESDSSHTLSFDWFAQDYFNAGVSDAGNMSKDSFPNHHFRVDIVDTSFTDWFGPSSSAGVLANLISPTAEAPLVEGFNNATFDLTAFSGSTVRLAFRNVEYKGFFHAGVDNVQIQSASIASVPEPTTILGLLALGGAGFVSRRKKQAVK